MIGDYIISAALPSGLLNIFGLHLGKLRVRHDRITGISRHIFLPVCFFRIPDVADNLLNGVLEFSLLSLVQWDERCGCDASSSSQI